MGDVAIEVLHLILSYLLSQPKNDSVVSEEQLQSFLNSLRKDFPRERVPAVLAPLLYHIKYQDDYVPLNFEVGNPLKDTVSLF